MKYYMIETSKRGIVMTTKTLREQIWQGKQRIKNLYTYTCHPISKKRCLQTNEKKGFG